MIGVLKTASISDDESMETSTLFVGNAGRDLLVLKLRFIYKLLVVRFAWV